jgi:hypothetical protein
MKSQANYHILTVCSLLLLTALACSSLIPATATPIPTATPLPTATSTPRPTDTPMPTDTPLPEPTADVFTVTYSDDFSDPDSGWPVWSATETDDGTSVEYVDGEYVIKFVKKSDWWMYPDGIPTNLYQASAEFTVKNPLRSSDLYFGVYCGYKDIDNYYVLFAHTNGYYRIVERVAGEKTVISPDESNGWARSEKIAKGAPTYKFRAECGWEGLVLYIDGIKIAQIENVPAMGGEVRLTVGSQSENGGEIHIDDFSVGEIIG